MKLAPIIYRQAQTLGLDRLITLLLFAIAAVGLLGCDENDPTGTDFTTSTEGAQAGAVVSADGAADGDISAAVAASDATALSSTIPLPINQSKATSGVLFGLTQTGTGPAAFFKINQTASAKDALLGQINGQGNAVHGLSTGTGHAGVFETTNASSFSAVAVIGAGTEGLRVQERGLGRAGVFENVNANSTSPTLFSETLARGEAGRFLTSNPNNQAPTLRVETLGGGTAGFFAVANSSNPHDALVATTSGAGTAVRTIARTGRAADFFAGTSKETLLATNTGSGFVARFEGRGTSKGLLIETQGGAGLQVSGGTKNAVVATPSGAKALYTEESTEVWFTDYGFGKLEQGRARILLDPSFAQTINPDEPYHIFVQSYGDAELYVRGRTPLGFDVALRAGDPNAEFSYRIVAKRLGFEQKRLEPAPWADRQSW